MATAKIDDEQKGARRHSDEDRSGNVRRPQEAVAVV
jgi:hypothetical protein